MGYGLSIATESLQDRKIFYIKNELYSIAAKPIVNISKMCELCNFPRELCNDCQSIVP
jgi:hypothetical protein